MPVGSFDLKHLRAIHRHLFQDIFDWAGEIRTVEIAKGGNQFQFRRYIETGMADVHRRIVAAGFLRGLSATTFARHAGPIMGDVNYAHPFREGNGRTQLHCLRQLADQAGHALHLTRIAPAAWLHASKEAHFARYDAMGQAIASAIPR
ncbi:Fic/DOC family protein [Allostella humosa]|uniref:Fic/DOC family protein n=1 Tax=Stella humosa TaxID=94 RepID=UPI0018D7C3EF|nr:Fic family protein [Stella humosa]